MVRRKGKSGRSRQSFQGPATPPSLVSSQVPSAQVPASATGPAPLPAPVVEKEVWYTVPRAAEILKVPVTRIFDHIRDGRVRVRFHAEAPGGNERPLVTSDELREQDPNRSTPPAPVAPPPRAEAHDAAPAVPAPAPASSKDPGPGTAASNAPASPDLGRFLEAERSARQAAERSLEEERVRRQDAEGKYAERDRTAKEVQTALDAERTIRQELERSLGTQTGRLRELESSYQGEKEQRERLESSFEEARSRVDALTRERDQSNRSLQEATRRADELTTEVQRLRQSLEEAEEKVDASLKAIYDRDVKVARLETEVSSSVRLQDASKDVTERLHTQITRLEDQSQDKEREIRRMALGLGEARAEIRLLRPPVEAVSNRRRLLRASLPWLLALGLGGLVFWLSDSLARAEEFLGSATLAGVSVLAAFGAGRLVEHLRSRS